MAQQASALSDGSIKNINLLINDPTEFGLQTYYVFFVQFT